MKFITNRFKLITSLFLNNLDGRRYSRLLLGRLKLMWPMVELRCKNVTTIFIYLSILDALRIKCINASLYNPMLQTSPFLHVLIIIKLMSSFIFISLHLTELVFFLLFVRQKKREIILQKNLNRHPFYYYHKWMSKWMNMKINEIHTIEQWMLDKNKDEGSIIFLFL